MNRAAAAEPVKGSPSRLPKKRVRVPFRLPKKVLFDSRKREAGRTGFERPNLKWHVGGPTSERTAKSFGRGGFWRVLSAPCSASGATPTRIGWRGGELPRNLHPHGFSLSPSIRTDSLSLSLYPHRLRPPPRDSETTESLSGTGRVALVA